MADRSEAARWFAALRRGVMTLDEQSEYAKWRGHPSNRAEIAGLQAIWIELDAAHDGVVRAGGGGAPAATRRRAAFVQSALIAFMFGAVLVGGERLHSVAGDDSLTTLDWWSR